VLDVAFEGRADVLDRVLSDLPDLVQLALDVLGGPLDGVDQGVDLFDARLPFGDGLERPPRRVRRVLRVLRKMTDAAAG
jgi:hypothetical protein